MVRYARLSFPDAPAFAWYRLEDAQASLAGARTDRAVEVGATVPLAGARTDRAVEVGATVPLADARTDRAVALSDAPWNANASGVARSLQDATFGVPTTPSKIICVGRNYAAHAKELGNEVPKEPLLFHKPVSSLLANGGTVFLPPESERVEQEAELAFVVGKRIRRATPDEARAAIFGYTVAFDITARDLQKKDVQFTRGKGFDTFCPVGPTLTPASEFAPENVDVRCWHNDVLRQNGNTRDMIFSVAEVLAYASAVMTFEPGDLILTGTPEGVGPLAAGDTLRMEIPGLDGLTVQIA